MKVQLPTLIWKSSDLQRELPREAVRTREESRKRHNTASRPSTSARMDSGTTVRESKSQSTSRIMRPDPPPHPCGRADMDTPGRWNGKQAAPEVRWHCFLGSPAR